MRRLGLLALLSAALGGGCGGGSPDETPTEVLRHFLEVMDRSADDETALVEAYDLLDSSAQRALSARAERAKALSGRVYKPWQMLVQGRFRLRFTPSARGGMRERVTGERALVVVSGEHETERAEVPLVREQGRWRVQLSLPPMRSDSSPVRQSDG